MIVIGCDPGISGAVAVIGHDGQLLAVHDMPTLSIKIGGKDRNVVDENQLVTLLTALVLRLAAKPGERHFVLEEVGAMPNEGPQGAFTFGRGYGVIRGVIAGMQLPRSHVRPPIWKRDLKLKKGKDASRQRAMELFPEWTDSFKLVKHDGRAEAALIAHWARHHLADIQPVAKPAPRPKRQLEHHLL